MAETESLRDVAHTPAPLSTWFGIVLLFFLFGAIVLAVIGPSARRDDYEQTRAKKRTENLKTLRDEAEKALTTYSWVDKNKGTVRIPIDRAVELSIADLSSKKVTSAGPIATPAPAQTPAAAPSVAPHPPTAGKPATSPAAPSAQPPVAPTSTPTLHPPGQSLPVRGKENASPTPS